MKEEDGVFDFEDGNGPVPAYRHGNFIPDGRLGGWVAKTATVCKGAFIEQDAKVYGNAYVGKNALISDFARVYGHAKIHGHAHIGYKARVFGHAVIEDSAIVDGHVKVFGRAQILDNAEVWDYAKIYGDAVISDKARIYGTAEVHCCKYSGRNTVGSTPPLADTVIKSIKTELEGEKLFAIKRIFDNAVTRFKYANDEEQSDERVIYMYPAGIKDFEPILNNYTMHISKSNGVYKGVFVDVDLNNSKVCTEIEAYSKEETKYETNTY